MPEAGRATVKFVGDYSALMGGLTSSLAPGKLKSVGLKAGAAIGAGFAAAGIAKGLADAVSVTKAFEKEMSSLGAITEANAKQMDRLRAQAVKMGAATVFSAREAAQAQTELAKGGLNTSQILGGALRSSLNLAAAGELELADAAETVVNSMQLFGLEGRATARIADMLATAANKTTADVADFSMALKQGGSVAKTAGYSLNDTVVILEALAEAGIKNSDAGTSMKASLIQLLNPTKKQADLAEQLGVSWIKQNGELKNGIEISKTLRAATEDMTKAERTKTFAVLAGTDGFRTLSALYEAGVGTLRDYSRANREQGTAAEVAAKKTDNLAGDVEQLSGAWETFQITVGSKLTPVLRDLTQVATGAVEQVTAIFNDKNLSGAEKFNKVVDLAVRGALRGFEELVKAAVRAAPEVASAFASGFASAPIWLQLAASGLLLKAFGGPAGVAAAGTRAGGVFTAAFASVTETYSLARSFGRGKGASAYAGLGSLALPLATSLFSTLARIIPGIAATFAIGDVIATVISGSLTDALKKVAFVGGGAALGAVIGSIFPGVGTVIGASIGAGLGSALSNLFGGGGEVEKTLREKIRESSKRLREGIKAEVASIANLRGAVSGQVNARKRQVKAARDAERAQRALNQAVRRHGPASDQATLAQARYKIALDRSRKAEDRLRNANKLQGAVRRATIKIMRDNVQEGKFNVAQLQRERSNIIRNIKWGEKHGDTVEDTKNRMRNLRRTSKDLDSEQTKVNRTIKRAGDVIGPKFAKALEKISGRTATMSRVMPQLERTTTRAMTKSRSETQKTSLKFEAFGDVVIDTRRSYGNNVGQMLPAATGRGMGRINELLQENLDKIQNIGSPQAKRRGGLIEWARQKFRNGGVPVAVSSGEVFKTPDGKWGSVPGQPTASDNVLTTMPVGTKVFTFDGQRRLMEGASESEALRSQLPHFASGGIVKPKIVGGTERGAEVANAAVGKVHDRAKAKLKAAKASAPGVAGPLGKAAGDIGAAMALAQSMGLTITSGWPVGTPGAHSANSYHYQPGRAFDASNSSNGSPEQMAYAKAAAAKWGSKILELYYTPLGYSIKNGAVVNDGGFPDHYDHVHTAMRKGGIVGLLQALYTGGQVKVVKDVGSFLMKRGFNHRAAAGILGNAYREGLWDPSTMEYTGLHNGGLYGFTTSPVSLQDVKNFADRRGKRWDDAILQTNFMLSHGDPTGMALRGEMNRANAIPKATEIFMSKWEKPGVPALGDRVAAAFDASKIMRDAGINGSEGGMSAAERSRQQAKRRREAREEQVQKLIQRAFAARSAQAKKGSFWQILDLYAKYGDFGVSRGAAGMAGGVMPDGKSFEAVEFLQRASSAASVLNPQRGSGQLYSLVKWLQGNVELTGSEDANDRLFNKLERVQEKGGKRAEKGREKRYRKMARLGENFPWGKALNSNEQRIAVLRERIENAVRLNTAEWSPGGSEYTDAEVANEVQLNRALLGRLDKKHGWLLEAIPYVENVIDDYQRKIENARKNPAEKWKIPGFKRGRDAARKTLGSGIGGSGLKDALTDLVGLTGLGGEWSDVTYRLKELGFTSTIEKQALQGISIGDLRQIIDFAAIGGYGNIPAFHSGGMYRAPVAGGEGPALLRDKEMILTPEQQQAVGRPVFILKVEDGAVNADRIKLIADNQIVEFDRRSDQFAKAGGV